MARPGRRQVGVRQAASPPVLRLRLDPQTLPGSALAELKDLLAGFPGDAEVLIELRTTAGHRRLRLGEGFRVKRSAALHAELDALLGAALVAEEREVAPAPPPDAQPQAPPEAQPTPALPPADTAEPIAASA